VSVAAAQSRRRLVAGRRRRSASRTELGITVLVSAGSARVSSDPSTSCRNDAPAREA